MGSAFPVTGNPLDILLPTIGSAGDVHPMLELHRIRKELIPRWRSNGRAN